MTQILENTLAVAVVLGVIVFVHELGHFLAAKAFGVRVETFSLGFGQRLVGFRKGETDYRISALPLGGYVKMTGETPGEASEPSNDPRRFNSKPRWQRFIIAAAGPAMNALLAVALLVPPYMNSGFPQNSFLDKPAVVAAVEPGSVAARAGIQPHDQIIRADGVNNPTWEQFGTSLAMSEGHTLNLDVLRNGQIVTTSLVPRADDELAGLDPYEEVIIEDVSNGSPAQRAGLHPGDRVLEIDHRPIYRRGDLTEGLQQVQGKPATLLIERGSQRLTVTVSPRFDNPDGTKPRWVIGTQISTGVRFVKLSFTQALEQSVRDNKKYGSLIFDLIGRLFTRKASLSSFTGPIGIASAAGEAARQPSLVPLLSLTSLISLNLGIINLLPIPVLDGGMILFLAIEGVMRREVSQRVKERVYQAGFAFLILLMSFVVYNDIAKSLGHGVH